MHDIDQDDESSFQMQDYDSINIQTVHFMTYVHRTAHTLSLMKSQVTGSFNVSSKM